MKSKRTFSVYIHTNKINNKVYIGMTSQKPYMRWKGGHGYKNSYFYNDIKKYGWNNFEHDILFTNLTRKEAEKIEIELIKKYKSTDKNYGYNICSGGIVNYGFHLSDEARKKIREAHLGKSPGNKGLHLSNETKEKISKAQKGKPKPSLKGRKLSEETIEKMSKKIICIEKNKIYNSIKSACEENNILASSLSNCLKGLSKTCGGYHWRYYNV